MFGNLLKAAVGTVLLPVDALVDVVTLPEKAYDNKEFGTVKRLRQIGENIDKALDPED